MTGQEAKRVLVVVDNMTDARYVMQTAAEISRTLQRELLGLFVEDLDLINLARLPFGQTVLSPLGTLVQQDMVRLEQHMRHTAREVRAVLERFAGEARIHCSFQVSRGHFFTAVQSCCQNSDLLLVSREGHAATLRRRRPPAGAQRPVMVFHSGAAEDHEAVMLAASIAGGLGKPLHVLVPERECGKVQAEIEALLQPLAGNCLIQSIADDSPEAVARAGNLQHCALLVALNSSAGRELDDRLKRLATLLHCPLALV